MAAMQSAFRDTTMARTHLTSNYCYVLWDTQTIRCMATDMSINQNLPFEIGIALIRLYPLCARDSTARHV